MAPYPATWGVILAGGRARRMGGGNKPLLTLQGQTLLARVQKRLRPQCAGAILNANGDPTRFVETGLTVISDDAPEPSGPLGGILAALEWTALHQPSIEWVVSVPGDTPFIPDDLVLRLHDARMSTQHPLACAASGSREHYATGLWPVYLRQDLRSAVYDRGICRTGDWARSHGLALASWPTDPVDPFFNINTPEDLEAARTMLDAMPGADEERADSTGPGQEKHRG